MAKFSAVLDACVLYPAPLRDLLIELATARLFRAKWTNQIQEEWISNLLLNRPDLNRDALTRTKDLMQIAVPDSLISGYEGIIPSIKLPDENDRHVVAAAVRARADAIVTYNQKDFPSEVLAPLDLEAIHPDDFIINQFDLNLADCLNAAQRCIKRLTKPPVSVEQWLATLESQSLPKTAAALRPYSEVLKP